ncbi:MAG: metallophosphoesterase [Bacteroidota bacterium]
MRLLIALLLLFCFDSYVFQALALVAEGWPSALRWGSYALFWTLPLLVLAHWLGIPQLSQLRPYRQGLMWWRSLLIIAYLSKFFGALVLLFDDFRRLLLALYYHWSGSVALGLDRSVLNAEIALVVSLIPLVLLTYGMIRNPYRYRVFREKVPLPNLPEELVGLKIVQISDIHSGSFTQREPIKEAIRLINAERADLVFFTGDLVNSVAAEMHPFVDIFDKIEARYGVYSILGNHDYGDYHAWESVAAKRENFQNLLATHRRMGWDLMLNEHRLLDIRGHRIAVIGVENYSASARFHKYGDLSRAYAGTEGASLKLLLSHDPSHWEAEVTQRPAFSDIAITFSGHTHGMQFGIEIPGWWRWSPIQYVYRKWAGLYREGKQYLYVNRGLGFLGYPGRVGILPEITVVELEKA